MQYGKTANLPNYFVNYNLSTTYSNLNYTCCATCFTGGQGNCNEYGLVHDRVSSSIIAFKLAGFQGGNVLYPVTYLTLGY